ncbi:MAG: hypothetical protein KKB90_12985 [Actinobacteria bacterium]|nr:hypothetical protein [Actinomycetota bacterium]MCG2820019.1 hypothetical protein [Actinomycetes bacterium]MBU4178528.1 hypothetical protein [Actinomycetota bacterium]MBU4219853.1 hypothetical protein [Actinomycetota bacterium]MBU4358836.1 hypothetical protein [Actinomycetota bacterium]
MTGELAEQAAILVGMLTLLALMSYLLSRVLSGIIRTERLFYLLLAPGTIVHELCHLLASLVCFVPVYEAHLFRVRRCEDGTVQLGEVVHADVGPIRNGIIGMAPLFGISALIYLSARWLLPEGGGAVSILTCGWTYLFLLLSFLLALGLAPSVQDLKSLPAFVVTSVVLGTAGYFLGKELSSRYNISSLTQNAVRTVRSVNSGLVLVALAIGATCLIAFLAGRLLRATR